MKPYRTVMFIAASLVLLFAACYTAIAATPLPTASPESVGLSGEKLAAIGAALEAAVANDSFPGAVVMVARKGKLVYSAAVGSQTPSVEMSEDSIFRIYSMTKPLVSVAAMMLFEEGKIQLIDPVGKYLPGFDEIPVSVAEQDRLRGGLSYRTVPAERPMTIHDLLRHTSGLAYGEISGNPLVKEGYEKAGVYGGDLPFDARGMTPDEQVARMAKAPLAYQPGTVWFYGLSTDILGRVIEVVSGERLGAFMRNRLFGPLRMNDTGFWVPAESLTRIAEPLPQDKTTGRPIVLVDVTRQPKNDSGGAGAVSTAGDYLRFCQMLLNGGVLDGTRVISRTTVKLMTSDHLGSHIAQPLEPGELGLHTKGYTFGLGFAVRKEDGIAGIPGSAGEFMWGGYAGTFFWVDPTEELTAVLMTQAPTPERAHFRRLVKQLVYAAIID